MKKAGKRVIPGFGLSMGVTLSMVSLIVIIPLASLVIFTSQMSLSEIWETITRERVLASFKVSFITAFVASLVNGVIAVIAFYALRNTKLINK